MTLQQAIATKRPFRRLGWRKDRYGDLVWVEESAGNFVFVNSRAKWSPYPICIVANDYVVREDYAINARYEVAPPPEPATFKRPRVYLQLGKYNHEERIRIIYPSGECEWVPADIKNYWDVGSFYRKPCWAESFPPGFTDGWQALQEMHSYDYEEGWNPAKFMGEL